VPGVVVVKERVRGPEGGAEKELILMKNTIFENRRYLLDDTYLTKEFP
jgi:hypothetical protein